MNIKNPVILVHGIGDKESKMKVMATYLRNAGLNVYTITLTPSFGQIGIDDLAKQLDGFIKNNFSDDQKIDLVGFSMGGLVCRYYIQRIGGLSRTEHFITISSPHNGSWLAYFLCNKGVKQMRPHSEFLKDLNSDILVLNKLKFTSIWTPLDLTILPASSSHTNIGNEIRISGIAHPLMVRNKKCLRAVEIALSK